LGLNLGAPAREDRTDESLGRCPLPSFLLPRVPERLI
jgi:hypothetical protein